VLAPDVRFRQYWSRRIDGASMGAVRFVDVSGATPDVAAAVVLEGALLEFAPTTPLARGATYEARSSGPLDPRVGGAVILARFQVSP
jgi:hypothetical protein